MSRWFAFIIVIVVMSAGCKPPDTDRARCERREALRPGGTIARNVDQCVSTLGALTTGRESELACLRACLAKPTAYFDVLDCEDDCTGKLPDPMSFGCVKPPGGEEPAKCMERFRRSSDAPAYKAAARCARRAPTFVEATVCADQAKLPPAPFPFH